MIIYETTRRIVNSIDVMMISVTRVIEVMKLERRFHISHC